MSLFESRLKTVSTASVFGFYISQKQDDDLELNPDYQRDYVWDEANAQALLYSIFNHLPIGSVSVILDPKADKYCEIVDGKQRITTLLRFYENEFPVYVSAKNGLVLPPELLNVVESRAIYFKDMSGLDQRNFKKLKLPQVELSSFDGKPVTRADKLSYFHRTNFSGVPISDEHRKHIESLLLAELRKS
jgi:hypothetical protein